MNNFSLVFLLCNSSQSWNNSLRLLGLSVPAPLWVWTATGMWPPSSLALWIESDDQPCPVGYIHWIPLCALTMSLKAGIVRAPGALCYRWLLLTSRWTGRGLTLRIKLKGIWSGWQIFKRLYAYSAGLGISLIWAYPVLQIPFFTALLHSWGLMRYSTSRLASYKCKTITDLHESGFFDIR